jgi:uncharacterized protein YgiM (DUF1202 family)
MKSLIATGCLIASVVATGALAAPQSVPVPNSSPPIVTVADRQMEVAVANTHLRMKPSTQSAKLATLKVGTKVDVMGMVNNGQWAHVKLGEKEGYIRADLLK